MRSGRAARTGPQCDATLGAPKRRAAELKKQLAQAAGDVRKRELTGRRRDEQTQPANRSSRDGLLHVIGVRHPRGGGLRPRVGRPLQGYLGRTVGRQPEERLQAGETRRRPPPFLFFRSSLLRI